MKTISSIVILAAILLPSYAFASTAPVDFGGKTINIDYTGQGVTISSIQVDSDFMSLIVDVDVSGSPGVLDITLPRTLIDSKLDGNDESFIVIADGDEPNVQETTTNAQSRILRIELPAGTDEVEIIGTVLGSPEVTPEPTPTEPEPTTEPTPTEPEPTTEPTPTEPEPTTPTPTTPAPTTPAPTTEKPKVECGEGTVLKDGACVLDERCGSGTILKDGVCVAMPEEPTTTTQGTGKQLVIGVVAAFIISLVVIAVLYIIGRGSKSSR